MATSTTKTVVADFTWANADFSWESDTAGAKPWNDANRANFTLSDTNFLRFQEKRARKVMSAVWALYAQELLTVIDSYPKQVKTLGLKEHFGISDGISFSGKGILRIIERLIVSEKIAWYKYLLVTEGVAIVEGVAKRINVAKFEQLTFEEVMLRRVDFQRNYGEAISVLERVTKNVTKKHPELLKLFDAIVRNANGVVSDLEVYEEAYALEDFVNRAASAPAGFSEFFPFMAGEHGFKEALFKTVLTAAATETRPLLTDMLIAVDVPDVIEQGDATVPVAGRRVLYEKDFYRTPHLRVLFRSGPTLATPEISQETEDGYTVKLNSITNPGTYVSGIVSWAAEGY